jgi:hypothetical protein
MDEAPPFKSAVPNQLNVLQETAFDFSLVSTRLLDRSLMIQGMSTAINYEEIIIPTFQKETSPEVGKVDEQKMMEFLDELSLNSMMRSSIDIPLFGELIPLLMNRVLDFASNLDHVLFSQILTLMKENREDISKLLFKQLWGKRIIITESTRPLESNDFITELIGKIESKNKELDKRVSYVAYKAKSYENFIQRKEILYDALK